VVDGGGIQWFHQWVKGVEYLFNKVRALAHEGIMKAVESGPVSHFFSKNICRVAFAVCHGKSPIFNSIANWVFLVLNVAISFGFHIMTPLDTSAVVVK
jgi:hypothetical protein